MSASKKRVVPAPTRTGNKRSPSELEQAQRDISSRLHDLPSNFVACRDPGVAHAWFVENDFHVIKMQSVGKKIEALGRDSQCGRCGTVKKERFVVTAHGIEKTGHSYEYPEGYIMPGVPRGVKRSTIVYQENYRRAMEAVAKALPGERETAER